MHRELYSWAILSIASLKKNLKFPSSILIYWKEIRKLFVVAKWAQRLFMFWCMSCNCVSDIDECKRSNLCNQKCHNTIGGYNCSCGKGYELIFEGNRTVQTGCHLIPGNQLIKTSIVALCKCNNVYKNCTTIIIVVMMVNSINLT